MGFEVDLSPDTNTLVINGHHNKEVVLLSVKCLEWSLEQSRKKHWLEEKMREIILVWFLPEQTSVECVRVPLSFDCPGAYSDSCSVTW